MELTYFQHPNDLRRIWTLEITDGEFLDLDLSHMDKFQLDYFNRPDATIEETLMGLQILARKIEEKVAA